MLPPGLLLALLTRPPQNLFLNSIWAGGTPPTSWNQPTGTGTLTAVASAFPGHTALRFQASTERPNLSQTIGAIASGEALGVLLDVEAIGSSIPWSQLLSSAGVTATFTMPSTNCTSPGRYLALLSVSVGGSLQLRVGLGASSNTTGDITLSRPQLIRGPVRRTYAPTTTLPIGA